MILTQKTDVNEHDKEVRREAINDCINWLSSCDFGPIPKENMIQNITYNLKNYVMDNYHSVNKENENEDLERE